MLHEKQKELDEMTRLFEEFKLESAELEDVLEKQSELFQQELDQEREKSRLMELSAAQQITQLKLQHLKELKQRDDDLVQVTTNLNMYKSLCEKLTANKASAAEAQNAAVPPQQPEKPEFTQENFDKLAEQVESKNQAIESLVFEVEQTRAQLKQQQDLFKKLTDDVAQFSAASNKRLEDIEGKKQNQIKDLQEELRRKNEVLSALGLDDEEQVQKLRDVLTNQAERLQSIQRDFAEFKQQSYDLLQKEKAARDLRIEELEKKYGEKGEQQ